MDSLLQVELPQQLMPCQARIVMLIAIEHALPCLVDTIADNSLWIIERQLNPVILRANRCAYWHDTWQRVPPGLPVSSREQLPLSLLRSGSQDILIHLTMLLHLLKRFQVQVSHRNLVLEALVANLQRSMRIPAPAIATTAAACWAARQGPQRNHHAAVLCRRCCHVVPEY